jgi:NTP pyrophosphatase (non-canonical NTP hydrolase)
MWEQARRLHDYHGDVPAEVRLLKLTEEVGEAAEALIGMRGLNSRKGICRTQDDLLAELADVIITAAVAMSGIAGDVDEARSHLEKAPGYRERAGRALTRTGDACERRYVMRVLARTGMPGRLIGPGVPAAASPHGGQGRRRSAVPFVSFGCLADEVPAVVRPAGCCRRWPGRGW